ncbi:CRISPR-associated helicase Cas3' [Heyndrickxia coagulans]|uniref:CRISPR-associated helicase Cas3' n=1 Tax=Heyndrickxia coagulans TaxID=1398 RepID=UPI0018A7B7F2|nr:CRISPR-associated helicase Cas3' [Heyndrickxia coagulans]MBF8417523.1 CRISPR-associated helicase Cas3' [Heyndrickxia coagulans]MEC5269359.1 CRISPR-associated helicase Cas3' [Heyndrickxia coagulans]UZH05865.1 CRISPR-associated helicase Cas3' [Heyndrickxia coagulans]
MEYIAHIRERDQKVQTVEEHLLAAKDLAETYGEKIGVKHITGLAALLHDLGKYTHAFRNYILEAVNNPDHPPKRGSVDHSTAGGKLLFKMFHSGKTSPHKALLAEMVGNAIISHHSYLQDFISPEMELKYLNRVESKEIDEFETAKKNFFEKVMSPSSFSDYVNQAEIELKHFIMKDASKPLAHKMMFLTKYIFSALIDADRTNTRLFEENRPEIEHTPVAKLFNQYYEKLLLTLDSFKENSSANARINRLRSGMSEQCDAFAEKPSGIYTLSIPTGGGKTFASLRYALKHAQLYNKKRIIYVVPFTTIIEQNAEEVRKVLQDDVNILEHHSNVVEDADENDEQQDGIMSAQQRLKLARDNWDAPIIFTTMVQFLNVFYAKGSRNIRRLHNMSEAVLIFDEVQKVPVPCISLFNEALNFLKTYCHSSILLCTATQPALNYVEHQLQVSPNPEIIRGLDNVIDAFKRVEIVDRATDETFNTEKLANFIEKRMTEVSSVLVILNTKGVVKKLYEHLNSNDNNINIFHLSTSMCAAHRNQILEEVRHCLDAGKKVICVSTQLIEAGVDVSFECVIRSLAGLDSIAQAAGRCNRHGEKETGFVYVINHEEENLSRLPEIKKGKETSKRIFIDLKNTPSIYNGNVLSIQAMEKYFKEFYTAFDANLDYNVPSLQKNMVEMLTTDPNNYSYVRAYCSNTKKKYPLFLSSSFYTAAEKFRVIDDKTTSVIVPFGKGNDVIAELSSNATIEDLSKLMKKAQQYTINLYSQELGKLERNGGIISLFDGKILALKEGAYDHEFGLNVENDSELDFLSI